MIVCYWGVGFQNDFSSFISMYIILVLLAICGTGIGFMVSAISNNIN